MTENNLPGRWIENHFIRPLVLEIEHVLNRASDLVERAISDLRQLPVLFDEFHNRALVGQRVVHKILLRVRRNH